MQFFCSLIWSVWKEPPAGRLPLPCLPCDSMCVCVCLWVWIRVYTHLPDTYSAVLPAPCSYRFFSLYITFFLCVCPPPPLPICFAFFCFFFISCPLAVLLALVPPPHLCDITAGSVQSDQLLVKGVNETLVAQRVVPALITLSSDPEM